MQAEYRGTILDLSTRLEQAFGSRLVSLVLYGSVARGQARADSDIDVLAVIHGLPPSLFERQRLVAPAVEPAEATLKRSVPDGWISLVTKTPDEVRRGGPLFYDMTVPGEAEVLFDRDGFMAGWLDELRGKMTALGSRRLWDRGHPYWDLKPDWKPGDVIDL